MELSLQERRRGRKVSTVGRLHPLVPEGERLGEKGGAFLNGKEGFCPLEGEPKGSKRLLKVGFRKKSFLAGETER